MAKRKSRPVPEVVEEPQPQVVVEEPQDLVYAPFPEGGISLGYHSWEVRDHVVVDLKRDDPDLRELRRIFNLTFQRPE